MSAIRVALADDHPVVLAGIRTLLQDAPEVELVGEATDGATALELVLATAPDVAVVDISMPGLDGLELARRVAEDRPGVRLLVLTLHEDRGYVRSLLQAGAKGYVLKRSAAEELVRAIRAVAAGGVYLDPAVAGKVLPGAGPGQPERAGLEAEPLSQREEEVLRLTAQGFSNKEIGARLAVSARTVETYKARASEKLGLRTRAEIVRHAAARGWLDGLGPP